MKPNLINTVRLQQDLQSFQFDRNSYMVNTMIFIIFCICIALFLYIFKSPYTKEYRLKNNLHTLKYILKQSQRELDRLN